MNLVLDTLKSRRSFLWLGNSLGLLGFAGLYRLILVDTPYRGTILAAVSILVFELILELIDSRAKRLRKIAPNAFPFKNLSEDDRAFLQESLMKIPARSAMRSFVSWSVAMVVVGALNPSGSNLIGCIVFAAIISAICQYYGNIAMGRRVAPFYYFDDDSPGEISKHVPSFRRRLWMFMLGPVLLIAGPIPFMGYGNIYTWIWQCFWALIAMTAGLRLFQDVVVAPIEDLGSALSRFGEGDFTSLLDVTSGDALGVTTNLYNKTVRKIDRRFFIRENFGHMIAGEKTELLFEGGLKLDGEQREIAVLVARVSGEGLTIKAFNKFCDSMIETVNKHGGALDDLGDGCLVAFFNAPLVIENAEGAGLEAAKEIKERLEVFRAQQKMQAGLSLQIGMGFASGPVMLGLIGPKGRQRYSAIGKPVEEARRLAGL